MIALHFSRTELELLVNAIEVAGQTCWPNGDDRVRVSSAKPDRESYRRIAKPRLARWRQAMTARGVDYRLPPIPVGDSAVVKILAKKLRDDSSDAGFTISDL